MDKATLERIWERHKNKSKLNYLQFKKLVEFVEKACSELQIDSSSLDIEAIVDFSLNYKENLTALKNHLKQLGWKEKLSVKEVKELKESYDREARAREEEYYKQEWEKRLKEIKAEANPDILQFYPPNFKPLVDMLIKGYIKTLFVVGDVGTGKTYNLNYLLPRDTIRIGGHITPYKLYSALYNAKDGKILFFDDTEDMLDNDIVISILKQALDTTEPRKVCWISSRNEKIDLPEEFIFNSRIVFVMNRISRHLEAIVSRAHLVEIELGYYDFIQMMCCIAKNPISINGVVLAPEERQMIVDFIKENSDQTTENFSLRTQAKIEQYYAYDKESWKLYAKLLLSKKDDLLEMVKKLLESGKPISECIKEFNKIYHRSRATFYRLRKKLMSHFSSNLEYMYDNLESGKAVKP